MVIYICIYTHCENNIFLSISISLLSQVWNAIRTLTWRVEHTLRAAFHPPTHPHVLLIYSVYGNTREVCVHFQGI